MDEHMTSLDQEEYLKSFMVFRVQQTLFSIRTLEVQAIQKVPETLTAIPDAAPLRPGHLQEPGGAVYPGRPEPALPVDHPPTRTSRPLPT